MDVLDGTTRLALASESVKPLEPPVEHMEDALGSNIVRVRWK